MRFFTPLRWGKYRSIKSISLTKIHVSNYLSTNFFVPLRLIRSKINSSWMSWVNKTNFELCDAIRKRRNVYMRFKNGGIFSTIEMKQSQWDIYFGEGNSIYGTEVNTSNPLYRIAADLFFLLVQCLILC